MAYQETMIVTDERIDNIQIADPALYAAASAHIVHVSEGGILSAGYVRAGGTCYVSAGGSLNGLYLQDANPFMYVYAGGKVTNLRIGGAGAKNLIVSGGTVITYVQRAAGAPVTSVVAGGVVSNMSMAAGRAILSGGGTISGATVTGGVVTVDNLGLLLNVNATGANTIALGATGARLGGANTVIAAGALSGGNPGYTRAPGVLVDLAASGNWQFCAGLRLENLTINDGGYAHIQDGAVASDVTLAANGKGLFVSNTGVATNVTMNGGSARIYGGGDLVDVKAAAGTINLFQANAGLGGSKTEFAAGRLNGNAAAYAEAGTLHDFTTVLDVRFVSGLHLENLTVTGARKATLNDGVTASGVTVAAGANTVDVNDGARVFGATVNNGGAAFHVSSGGYASGVRLEGAHKDLIYMYIHDGGVAEDVSISDYSYKYIIGYDGARLNGLNMSGGQVQMSGGVVNGATVNAGELRIYAGATAVNPVIESGGTLTVYSGGTLENAVIKTNTLLKITDGANTGDRITLDFAAATGTSDMQMIDYVNRLSPNTSVWLTGVHTGATYLGTNGNLGREVYVSNGLYSFEVPGDNTTEVVDAAYLRKYSFNGGRRLFTAPIEVTSGAALSLTAADTYESGGANRAALWTDDADADVAAVAENFGGDAYVTLGGAALTKALYGAADNYDGTVNLRLLTGELNNLAAGAQAGKTVGAVKLTFAGADMKGVGYAGGFGNVTGRTETLVYSSTIFKDFYAGALANHAKTGTVTSVGDIALTVWGGEFRGNLYGASAVKASAANAHTAGDVTLTITNGRTTKSNFCCFAGGYATGSAADATVYTVGNVTVDVSGGSWGEAHGGRGLFGGVMASGVGAQAGNVTISVSGGSFGNVHGGGWAQKGGVSTVGNVDITIAGDATVANVFGGGSHSTSGGATAVAGDVTITVAGGNITNAIYAKGHTAGDSVTGTVRVNFTGRHDCVCDVFGYSYVGGDGNSDALVFTDYTGSFTGAIGGFAAIKLAGDTELTLATDAEKSISNSRWEFDLTERDSARRGDALVNLDAFNDHSSVIVTFADDAQAQGGWNLARIGDVNAAVFDLTIGDTGIATDLAFGGAISGGAYDGWGFTLDDGMLKFQKLA